MSLYLTRFCLRIYVTPRMMNPLLIKHQQVLTGMKTAIPLCLSCSGASSKHSLSRLTCCRNYSSSSTNNFQDVSEDVMKHLEAETINNRRRKLSPTDEMINVGRLVPHRVLDLVDDNGETLRSISSSNAVKLSQKKELKLVLVSQHAKPLPLYKLMTGSELHQEQMKTNEKRKSKVGPTVVKDVKLSATIGVNDINVKRKHMSDWLSKEDNIQIRVTVMQKGRQAHSKEDMIAMVQKLIEGLEGPLIFNNEPKAIGKNGQNISVVLRRMSTKEKARRNKEENLLSRMKSTSLPSDGEREEP